MLKSRRIYWWIYVGQTGRKRNAYRLVVVTPKEDPGVYITVISKYILKKQDGENGLC
jgi:hypothetical protein